jgi:bromodomain adjacent to zinc finger domain protein 1A
VISVVGSSRPYRVIALALEKEREAEKLLAKAEAERQAAEKKKKKPIRYPTEDLDVVLSEKEKKAGTKVRRPTPSCTALPFNERKGSFESFLMAWNFLVVYG